MGQKLFVDLSVTIESDLPSDPEMTRRRVIQKLFGRHILPA